MYDWVALLWAALDEAPAKELLANVNYRRALLPFQTARACFGQECAYQDNVNTASKPSELRITDVRMCFPGSGGGLIGLDTNKASTV